LCFVANFSTFSPTDLSQPLYHQIANWIEGNVKEGRLLPGEKLPTVRALAQLLDVNRGSVALAYTHLTKMGLLQARVGQGTFIRPSSIAGNGTEEAEVSGEEMWQPVLAEAAVRLGLGKPKPLDDGHSMTWVPERGEAHEGKVRIPMDVPLADHRLNHDIIQGVLREVADSLSENALAYGHPQGSYALRTEIAERAIAAGVQIDPRHILICNGTQQALNLASTLLVQPGDTVMMENPGYPGAVRAFRMCGARILGIPVDASGMRVNMLERMLRDYRPKLIYTIPSFQVPTGATLDAERRAHLYRLAEVHQIPILEDEYVNSLYYGTSPVPPLKALDRSGLVMLLGTFSKTLGASMRLGWIAAHPTFIARLVQVRELQDIHTSLFSQLTVEKLLREGAYERHLENLRQHYGLRYQALTEALNKKLGKVLRYHPAGGGFSVWTAMPEGVGAADWLVRAKARGVHFELGTSYFLDSANDNYARLSFSLLSVSEIRRAVDLLAKSLDEAMRKGGDSSFKGDLFVPFS
jgi:DNA-binding transcriptional MocR family regulator